MAERGRRWRRMLLFLLGCGISPAAAQGGEARNVLFVTLDGMRWQEVFDGASLELMGKEAGGVPDSAALAARFWRFTAEGRREALMPFLWGTVAKKGQIFGDPARGSEASVTNPLWFSYPGYNEMLTGAPDPRIDSNDSVPNPNVTVLEWLNRQPKYRGQIAAFGSWELLPYILNVRRSGVYANGDGLPVTRPTTDRERLLNEFAADLPPYWGATRFDAPTMEGALEYLRTRRPRLLYVMLGETDEWAHDRRYDLYLDAAWRGDRFIRRLWEAAQALPQYAGKTALVISTDHGRGNTSGDWTDHDKEVAGSGRIWIAVMDPRIPGLGVRDSLMVSQAQIAATLAALLGEDYRRAAPGAAPPLPF